MANPILVEVTRGDRIESVHRGAVAIADATGSICASIGDTDTPIYPRSALKPIQALPLVESGALDAFALSDEHIALACASHSGEPMHTRRVAAWLERIGLSESDLACGPHPIRYDPEWRAMIVRGEQPTRIHNNCSGKHTGFLSLACHWNIAPKGYERIEHPVQQAVAGTVRDLSGVEQLPWGVDGCAAPNFVLPLSKFAVALARLSSPDGLAPSRARAIRQIVSAMIQHPELVSGTGRACEILIRSCSGRAVVKTGAEGVYAAILPSLGLGVAIKIDDGGSRAAEITVASILHSLRLFDESNAAMALVKSAVLNTRGENVGERRPASALSSLRLDRRP